MQNIMLCFRTPVSEHLFQNTCFRTPVSEQSFRTTVSEHLFQNNCFRTTVSEQLFQINCFRTTVSEQLFQINCFRSTISEQLFQITYLIFDPIISVNKCLMVIYDSKYSINYIQIMFTIQNMETSSVCKAKLRSISDKIS